MVNKYYEPQTHSKPLKQTGPSHSCRPTGPLRHGYAVAGLNHTLQGHPRLPLIHLHLWYWVFREQCHHLKILRR